MPTSPTQAKKRAGWRLALTFVCVGLSAFLLPVAGPANPQRTPERAVVQVPDLVKRSVGEARRIVERARLQLGEVRGTETDVIVAQRPPAGTRVPAGTTILVRTAPAPAAPSQAAPPDAQVSVPTRTVRVPNLIGQTAAQARETLQATNLQMRPSSDLGTVVAQAPAPGTPVRAGSVVSVRVVPPAQPPAPRPPAGGEFRPVSVPNLVGETVGQAKVTLSEASLRMEGTQTSESDVVTAQQPPAGARVQPGTAVRVRTQPMTTVPDLTKRDVGSALVLLQRSRLRLGNAGENSSDIIIGQAPRAGTRVPWGTTVIVKVAPPVVGKPPGTTDSDLVQVPKLVGGTVGQARTKLSQSRLRMARVNANESATVVTQDPTAGSRVPAGSLVSVLSEEGVLVPNLVNQSVANAKMMLHQAGLRLGNTPERDSDIVIGQEPPPGGRVRAGSPVSVQTQQRVRVPNVVNRSVAEGRNILGASGLRLENRGASDDVITAQDPPPGALVAVDSTVRVKTLDRVAIPDVVNRSVSDAKTILSQAGLRLSSDAGSESDRVVAQNPQAGTKVPTGSPVTVRTQHLVPVPNLVNRSVADARAALGVAELKLEGPSGKDSDTVGSQSPPAGTLVPAGSVVALKLANPPPPWKEVVGVLAGILAILGSGYFFRLKASGPQARKEALRRARIQVVAQIDLGGQQAETSPFAEAAPPLRIRLIGSEGEQTIGPPVKEAKAAHG